MTDPANQEVAMIDLGAEIFRLKAEIDALHAAVREMAEYHDNGQPHPKHLQKLAVEWAKNIQVLSRSAYSKYRQMASERGLSMNLERGDD